MTSHSQTWGEGLWGWGWTDWLPDRSEHRPPAAELHKTPERENSVSPWCHGFSLILENTGYHCLTTSSPQAASGVSHILTGNTALCFLISLLLRLGHYRKFLALATRGAIPVWPLPSQVRLIRRRQCERSELPRPPLRKQGPLTHHITFISHWLANAVVQLVAVPSDHQGE